MKMPKSARSALLALAAIAAPTSASLADSGSVTLTIYKGGWIIGGSAGSGVLDFHGKTYGLSAGGIDYGDDVQNLSHK